MSETAERETELVAGVIGGITQKKADTWTVAVTPEGSQYAKNLWTKDADLVEALSAKIGQSGAFITNASYWNRADGQQVRSLWIAAGDVDGVDHVSSVATPDTAVKAVAAQHKPSSEGLTKEEWRRKDIAADKRAYTAIAASALQHTMPSDPSTEDLNTFMSRVSHLTIAWMQVQNALRDGEDVSPF